MRKKIITRSGDTENVPYLVRWSLFSCSWFSIKLHHILISDEDCLHDHPWAFISIGLWGSYLEYRQKITSLKVTSRAYHAPWIIYRRAFSIHRLEVDEPVWTLVITFRKTREWGFWTRQGWIPWYKYSPKERC